MDAGLIHLVVTRLWAGTPRNQEPDTHNIHTDSGSHKVSFKTGTMGFSQGKHSIQELKNVKELYHPIHLHGMLIN
jgi:hypothetical protein